MQTYSKQQAFDKIKKLVETFAENEALLQKKAEAQIEQNYIRPLFSALNWNTENEGLSPADWEFVLQDTDKKGKRPDYRLQLNGQHLCLMDAKMVKYSMHDPRWQWQVYKYAYSTRNNPTPRKVDFGVLTDFQEFILLDCTFEAKEPEAVNNFRVLDWRYNDYVTQFDQLWELFERNNMLEASRDRKTGLWSRYLSPKQAKANRVAPDKGFLNKLDHEKTGWRIRLAKDMKKCCPSLTGEVITGAVQLIIDRFIFIKALTDRDIDDDYLAKLGECVEKNGLGINDREWFVAAKPLFERLNRFYDGSVFAPRPELEAVVTSNRVVRDIIRELDPNHSPYDLSVLPVEILGTIYERFLGRLVRTTDHQVKIEEKPEVKKAKGVYYTPSYIVDYIVEQTVGKLLADCKTPEDVAKLKILDPACGSGSFLLGAYNALIDWHKAFYATKTKPAREAAYRDANGDIRLTAKIKRQILRNNLFGVDIDQQAVEVTRFSLSLKALEDTRKDELDEERNLFKETVLPDLKNNITCGNSLIGTDILDGQLFSKDEETKLNPMDFEQRFLDIMAQGGFDVVIGNPPYRKERDFKEEMTVYRQYPRTKIWCEGKMDYWYLFLNKALDVCKKGEYISFITPSYWLKSSGASKLIGRLRENVNIDVVVDFGNNKVFEDAPGKHLVFVLSNLMDERGRTRYFKFYNKLKTEDIIVILEKLTNGIIKMEEFDSKTIFTDNCFLDFSGFNIRELANNIEKRCIPLQTVDKKLEVSQGIVEAPATIDRNVARRFNLTERIGEGVFVLSKKELITLKLRPNEEIYVKPYLRVQDVSRYLSEDRGYKVLYIGNKDNKYIQRNRSLFPSLVKHLDKYKIVITSSNKPYGIHRTRDNKYFINNKIIGPNMFDIPKFTYSPDEAYVNFAFNVIIKNDSELSLKYVLGLLNSKIGEFWFNTRGKKRGVNVDIGVGVLRRFPVHPIDFSDASDAANHDRMVELVEQILTAKKAWSSAQTEKDKTYYYDKCEALDEKINTLVYALYGLKKEEIDIVEAVQAPR